MFFEVVATAHLLGSFFSGWDAPGVRVFMKLAMAMQMVSICDCFFCLMVASFMYRTDVHIIQYAAPSCVRASVDG